MGLRWEQAVAMLSEGFGHSEAHGGYHVWWVKGQGPGEPCPILACQVGDGVRAWAGRMTPQSTPVLRTSVELLDVVQGARRLADHVA
jgi:hypothetical protein